MKHARKDYDRFQDPANKIPEDEPVMLFRAQDQYAVDALLGYVAAIYADPQSTPDAQECADVVTKFIKVFEAWDVTKSPDLEKARD